MPGQSEIAFRDMIVNMPAGKSVGEGSLPRSVHMSTVKLLLID